MRLIILLFCITLPVCAWCRGYDSTLSRSKITRNVCLRTELGWNQSWFASLGGSYITGLFGGNHGPIFMGVYSAAEANFAGYRFPRPFYAYKAGVEIGIHVFGGGLELRNNTDFAGNHQFVFTAKGGITFLGIFNLFYGHNAFKTEQNIFGISTEQLTLNININRKILKGSFLPDR